MAIGIGCNGNPEMCRLLSGKCQKHQIKNSRGSQGSGEVLKGDGEAGGGLGRSNSLCQGSPTPKLWPGIPGHSLFRTGPCSSICVSGGRTRALAAFINEAAHISLSHPTSWQSWKDWRPVVYVKLGEWVLWCEYRKARGIYQSDLQSSLSVFPLTLLVEAGREGHKRQPCDWGRLQ